MFTSLSGQNGSREKVGKVKVVVVIFTYFLDGHDEVKYTCQYCNPDIVRKKWSVSSQGERMFGWVEFIIVYILVENVFF